MSVFDQDNRPYDDEGLARHIDMALAVEPPTPSQQDLSYRVTKFLFNPVLVNTDNIPDRPCLFIGNHSLFALDGMVLGPVMLHELGRFLRPLGDRFLWNENSEERLLKQGAVIGDPAVGSALMEHGHDLLVFPGGAHEATKTAAEKYTLQWKERYGFVRLAAKHGYPILPFALVGPDEFYSHLMEGRDLPDSALGKLLRRLGLIDDNTRPDMLPPIPSGALGSLIPKPQRCYLQFGEPVETSAYVGKKPTKKQLQSLRDQVGGQIESMLADLLLLREQHRGEDGLLRRLLTI
jgi:1-acyl-sn-glycerol-3-phosphate acyltransferase